MTLADHLIVVEAQAEVQGQASGPGVHEVRLRIDPAATISILLDGTLHFNRQPVLLEDLPDLIAAAKAADPETKIYLALEAGEGSTDRGPILTTLWDRMKDLGLEIYFVGKPKD